MADATTEMPRRLLSHLRQGEPALLLTVGGDGYPNSAYTWAVALKPKRVRFAVDAGSASFENIGETGLAALHVIGPSNLAFLIKGEARKVKDRIAAAAPAQLVLYELGVVAARDQSFPGVAAKPFTYEWPADHRAAMLQMEQAVFAEMRLPS